MTDTTAPAKAPAICCVQISIYKPTGFEDTHYVATDDRGLAVKTVLTRYGAEELKFLNYVNVALRSPPHSPKGAAPVVILDPIAGLLGDAP